MNIPLVTNEELISAAAVGNVGKATKMIINNFIFLIRKNAGSLYQTNSHLGIGFDDLYNEGIKGVVFAFETFEISRGSFAAYAQVVIFRQMWTLIKRLRAPSRMILTNAKSLDMQMYDDNDRYFFSDSIGEEDWYMNYNHMPDSMVNHIADLVPIKLENDEVLVIKHKIAGYSYNEIADILKISRRQVFAIVKALRSKWTIE
ncbi:MAG: hypothetical protein ACOX28_02290 [Bacilli bacterium]|jgi:RNA polymerase sigma factor (sigma-70 family)